MYVSLSRSYARTHTHTHTHTHTRPEKLEYTHTSDGIKTNDQYSTNRKNLAGYAYETKHLIII